jgi:DnaJ domain
VIDFNSLVSFALTVLFNPFLLILLVMLFFLGKIIGRLSVRMNIWKFLALCFIAIFIFKPTKELGPILGTIFLLGFASNHFGRIPSIVSWAQSFSDVFFAFQHRRAYEEIQRQEREIEALKQQLHAAQKAAAQASAQSSQQQQWRAQAEQARQTGKGSAGGERGDGSSSGSQSRGNSGSSSSQQSKSSNQQKSQGQSSGSKSTSSTASVSLRDQHLSTLGLRPGQNYSPDEIKAAWRKMAKKTHPDTGGSKAAFIAVVNAYNYLK